MDTQLKITRQNVAVVAFFALLAGLVGLLFVLLEPFLRSFVWAVILSMVFYPVYHRFYLWMGKRRSIASLVTTVLVLLFLAFPGFYIFTKLGNEIAKAYTFFSTTQWEERAAWVLDKLQALDLGRFLEKWGVESGQSQQVLQNALANGLQDLSKILLGKMDYAFKHLAEFILESSFAAVALFFFFRDGAHYSIKVIELLPLGKEHQEKVARTFSKTVTAVVRAIFLTALFQGFLAGLGFVVTGVPLPIFWGVVAFINSFIPFLGAASVWIPASIWLFYQGQIFAALALTAWGILISIMDHILRPWLIGSEAKLPIFWLFFTTIGGLKVYGILGIFLGPIILSMGIAFLAIYREVYLNLKKPQASKKS